MIEERRKYFRSVCGVQILFLLRRYESIIFLLKSKTLYYIKYNKVKILRKKIKIMRCILNSIIQIHFLNIFMILISYII